MTNEQVAKVLARIQLGDNRQVDRATLAEWIDGIGDLDFDDAIEGVRMHRRDSTAYLQIAHVRANVRMFKDREARHERFLRGPAIAPQVITLDRPDFELQTVEAIEYWRKQKGGDES